MASFKGNKYMCSPDETIDSRISFTPFPNICFFLPGDDNYIGVNYINSKPPTVICD